MAGSMTYSHLNDFPADIRERAKRIKRVGRHYVVHAVIEFLDADLSLLQ